MADAHRMQVTRVQDFGRVKVFRLESSNGSLPFLSGQYVMVSLDGVAFRDRVVKRSYSIASSPHDSCVELCVARVEGGLLTPHLHELRTGDWVNVEGPLGRFILDKPYPKDLVFVAGGTGIAPIRSMIRTLAAEHADSRIRLFYGIRTPKEFLFEEELTGYVRDGFELTASVSEQGENGWPGERGYVTEALRKHISRWSGEAAYVCGPPPMVSATMPLLKEIGFPDNAVKKEQW